MASKKTQLAEWLARRQPPVIDRVLLGQLRQELEPISAAYLRRLLLQTGVPLEPEVEGVRLDDFAHFRRSLSRLSEAYARAGADARTRIRRQMIDAKNRARWSGKREMAEWLLVWLHDPAVFETWAKLRLQVIEARRSAPE